MTIHMMNSPYIAHAGLIFYLTTLQIYIVHFQEISSELAILNNIISARYYIL